jgi:membrane fusion protein (multidrug efflux system)
MSLLKQVLVVAAICAAAFLANLAYQQRTGNASSGPDAAGRSGGPERPAGVVVTKAEPRAMPVRIEAVGTTRARRAIDIVPEAAGRIVDIGFKPGQSVAAGQVIVRLDDDIEKADLAEAEAKLAEAAATYERSRRLRSSGSVTQTSLDQLKAQLATAEAELDRARRRLADRTVRAPFAGVLGLNRVELGSRVEAGTLITTLDDLSEVEIEFQLPETAYGDIRRGLEVTADAAAFGAQRFQGEISEIDSRIDAVSRSFKVRARFANADRRLPAGMFMRLTVVLDSRRVLAVPEEALTMQGAETFLYVVRDGKAERRTVTIGRREAGRVEITSGLAAGEDVVTLGLQRLRDGMPVEVRAAPEAAEVAP